MLESNLNIGISEIIREKKGLHAFIYIQNQKKSALSFVKVSIL